MAASLKRFGVERRMPAKTVNLDALIPRDDFQAGATTNGGSPRLTISLGDLEKSGFFQNSLRKPDFQRETAYWSPSRVVGLITAFLDRDLIPAVILWERGQDVFVIDGAHRLSALIAWVRDDYGDGHDSSAFFKQGLTDEQRAVAQQTRDLVRKAIGTYAEYRGLMGTKVSDSEKAKRITAIGQNSLQVQWVTAATPAAAEASFFKINQSAQPIDPVERAILQNRASPIAIASRCIVRSGQGHRYWAAFAQPIVEKIEELGAYIHDALFKPPLTTPVTTTDQPIAGQGYSSLPFVYEFVSLANGRAVDQKDKLDNDVTTADADGSQTVVHLEKVKREIELVSTTWPGSLGLHPLIYFYGRSGTFMQNAFFASIAFVKRLEQESRTKGFVPVRESFEKYIAENKLFLSLAINRYGSGSRSLKRISDLYWAVFDRLAAGDEPSILYRSLTSSEEFAFLKQTEIPSPSSEEARGRKASRSSRSAAFIKTALDNPLRCPICRGALHRNSMTFDHIERLSQGGSNWSGNLQPAHPYCNSTFKH